MTTKIGMDSLLSLFQEEVAGVTGIEPTAISATTNLVREYEVDSLELMEIASRLEDRLDIELDPHKLTATTTVGDVLDYLTGALGGAK